MKSSREAVASLLRGPRRPSKAAFAPKPALVRLKRASEGDLTVARLTLGLFEAISGRVGTQLFPGYIWTLSQIRVLPKKLPGDARAICEWAMSAPTGLSGEIYNVQKVIEQVVDRIRSGSPRAKRQRR